MKIKIEIDTANSAFGCGESHDFAALNYELKRVLGSARGAAVRHSRSTALAAEAVLFDSNGNRCGWVRTDPESERAESPRFTSFRHGDTRSAKPAAGAVCPRCGESAARSNIGETCSACGAGIVARVRS
jgi:hypothetical protein